MDYDELFIAHERRQAARLALNTPEPVERLWTSLHVAWLRASEIQTIKKRLYHRPRYGWQRRT
jgi:hypothetical protein